MPSGESPLIRLGIHFRVSETKIDPGSLPVRSCEASCGHRGSSQTETETNSRAETGYGPDKDQLRKWPKALIVSRWEKEYSSGSGPGRRERENSQYCYTYWTVHRSHDEARRGFICCYIILETTYDAICQHRMVPCNYCRPRCLLPREPK